MYIEDKDCIEEDVEGLGEEIETFYVFEARKFSPNKVDSCDNHVAHGHSNSLHFLILKPPSQSILSFVNYQCSDTEAICSDTPYN